MSEPTNIQLAGRHLRKTAIFFFLSIFCAVISTIVAVSPFPVAYSQTYLLFSLSLGCVTILCMIKALANLHMAGENLERKE
jgi:hypothetical protein